MIAATEASSEFYLLLLSLSPRPSLGFVRGAKDAQQRLEEMHREKVTRVMKDWSDLEEKYQDMRLADPKAAQGFKQRMTARFQVTDSLALHSRYRAESLDSEIVCERTESWSEERRRVSQHRSLD